MKTLEGQKQKSKQYLVYYFFLESTFIFLVEDLVFFLI